MTRLPGWDPTAPTVLVETVDAKRCCRRHPRVPDNKLPDGSCRRCNTVRARIRAAAKSGVDMCGRGHALTPEGVTADGRCEECALHFDDDLSAMEPPPEWLDWVAVQQALQGLDLCRPLTPYELVCALVTVQARNTWSRKRAADWLREETAVTVPDDNGDSLFDLWVYRHRKMPALTLDQAVGYQNRPDQYLAALAGEPCEVPADQVPDAAA